jgi:hypothetical protein
MRPGKAQEPQKSKTTDLAFGGGSTVQSDRVRRPRSMSCQRGEADADAVYSSLTG